MLQSGGIHLLLDIFILLRDSLQTINNLGRERIGDVVVVVRRRGHRVEQTVIHCIQRATMSVRCWHGRVVCNAPLFHAMLIASLCWLFPDDKGGLQARLLVGIGLSELVKFGRILSLYRNTFFVQVSDLSIGISAFRFVGVILAHIAHQIEMGIEES